ncbi:MAG: hypothetical protein GC161_09745 [Planctomycetaceae bacterium]|nr:hypothetical protein [Planctomycetaceae bacterium]
MSAKKHCFMDHQRPCDLTCKAAFEVDDPVDNIDCYFIWLSYHFGETLYELKRVLENFRGFPPGGNPGGDPGGGKKGKGMGPMGPTGPGAPKGPKDFPNN